MKHKRHFNEQAEIICFAARLAQCCQLLAQLAEGGVLYFEQIEHFGDLSIEEVIGDMEHNLEKIKEATGVCGRKKV